MRRAAIAVALLVAAAAAARGQADDRVAELTLAFDRSGAGWVALTVADPPGGGLDAGVVSRGLTDAIPADWSNVDRRRLGARWTWFLRRWPAPPEKRAVRPLDLEPLLTALRDEGVPTLRLTVVVHRFGDVACNLPARPALPGPTLVCRYGEDLATDRPAPPVEIRFDERPTVPRRIEARASRWSLAVAALYLAPMPFAAWRVRRLAAWPAPDHLGHAVWRLYTHGPLVTTLAWFLALGLTGGLALTTGWLDGPRPSDWVLRWLALFAAPPAAAILLAARVARPALDRLRAADWIGLETLETAPRAAVVRLIAAVLAGSAAVLLYGDRVTLGLSVLLAGWIAQVVGDALGERQSGKVVDQSDTELASDVRALARVLGVRVKAVGIIASATRRAELYGTPKVVLTPPLVEHFARPAVGALVAQGLARATTLAASPIAGVVMVAALLGAGASGLAVFRFGDELPAAVDWVPLTAAASLALCALSFRAMTRAANRAADGRAAWVTDPAALVAALAEQERRRGEPPDRSWLEDVFLPCPCAARRAAALARRYGWSPDDVAQLLATPVGADPSRYDVSLPPVPSRPDRKTMGAIAAALLVALPLAFAHAAEANPPGGPRAAVLAAGVVGAPLLYWVALWLIVSGKNAVGGHALRRRLRAEGVDPAELNSVLVAFAPDREAHNYDGSGQWDLGYLVPAGDRVLFIGRRMRAAVRWAAVELSGPPGDGARRPSRVVVTWKGGGFSVWPAVRPAPWGEARATAGLRARLEKWRDGRVSADALPAAWADLPPPPPTPDGVQPFRELVKARVAVSGVATLAVAGAAAAWLTGLPFVAEWRGAAYAVAVMVMTVFTFALPRLLLAHRHQPPTQ
jgi:hypothetical protein